MRILCGHSPSRRQSLGRVTALHRVWGGQGRLASPCVPRWFSARHALTHRAAGSVASYVHDTPPLHEGPQLMRVSPSPHRPAVTLTWRLGHRSRELSERAIATGHVDAVRALRHTGGRAASAVVFEEVGTPITRNNMYS